MKTKSAYLEALAKKDPATLTPTQNSWLKKHPDLMTDSKPGDFKTVRPKTKNEIPSHALSITGAEFLDRLKEVTSKKWGGKMKPMREDVAITIKEVMKHLAENPEAECVSWWEGEGNIDCDLFTVLIPKESPWLENMRYRIQYENKPGSFSITKAEIIEKPFSDWLRVNKEDALRIIKKIDFKGRAPFYRGNGGSKEEPFLFHSHRERWEEQWGTNPPERFEIDDVGKVSRIKWDGGHVTYDHSDPENLRLIDWRDDSNWEEKPEPAKPETQKTKIMKTKKTKKPSLFRYHVQFEKDHDLARKSAIVIAKSEPHPGQLIQLGRTAKSRVRVERVTPISGHVPQLGDLVLAEK